MVTQLKSFTCSFTKKEFCICKMMIDLSDLYFKLKHDKTNRISLQPSKTCLVILNCFANSRKFRNHCLAEPKSFKMGQEKNLSLGFPTRSDLSVCITIEDG